MMPQHMLYYQCSWGILNPSSRYPCRWSSFCYYLMVDNHQWHIQGHRESPPHLHSRSLSSWHWTVLSHFSQKIVVSHRSSLFGYNNHSSIPHCRTPDNNIYTFSDTTTTLTSCPSTTHLTIHTHVNNTLTPHTYNHIPINLPKHTCNTHPQVEWFCMAFTYGSYLFVNIDIRGWWIKQTK